MNRSTIVVVGKVETLLAMVLFVSVPKPSHTSHIPTGNYSMLKSDKAMMPARMGDLDETRVHHPSCPSS